MEKDFETENETPIKPMDSFKEIKETKKPRKKKAKESHVKRQFSFSKSFTLSLLTLLTMVLTLIAPLVASAAWATILLAENVDNLIRRLGDADNTADNTQGTKEDS